MTRKLLNLFMFSQLMLMTIFFKINNMKSYLVKAF